MNEPESGERGDTIAIWAIVLGIIFVLLTIIALLFLPRITFAEETKYGFVWCTSESAFIVMVRPDLGFEKFRWLLDHGKCVVLNREVEMTMLSVSPRGWIEVRVEAGIDSVVLWGTPEGIENGIQAKR